MLEFYKGSVIPYKLALTPNLFRKTPPKVKNKYP